MALTPYTPTTWVNDSEPDLEADNLNKIEQGIQEAIDGVNGILNALSSQIENEPTKFASSAALYAVNNSLNTVSTNLTTLQGTVSTLNSNLNVIGNAYSNNPPSYVPCDSGITTEIATLSLQAGTYFVSAGLTWSNTSRVGSRRIDIRQGDYYNSPQISGNGTNDFSNDAAPISQSVSGIITLSGITNIKLWATQTSGGNLSVASSAFLKAVRIK